MGIESNLDFSSKDLKAGLLDRNIGTYDVRIAFLFCLFLSAVLWWIPYLGPAIAGYICGRKSGSMVKGTICAVVAGAILLAVVWGLSFAVTDGVIYSYLAYFFNDGMTQINFLYYGVLVVFAFVGGVMTRQIRRETEDLLRLGATDMPIRYSARSVRLYEKNKELGFECFDDCIASQNIAVNESFASKEPKPVKINSPRSSAERSPAVNTVQTVTSTVNECPTSSDCGDSSSPFDDILNRSERRKK